MTANGLGDDRLREAFAESESLAWREDCPPAEGLWRSARGELEAGENASVIRHLVECAECSALWRVARDLSDPEAAEAAPAARSPSPRGAWPALAAAAGILLAAAVALQAFTIRPGPAPGYRAEEGAWIRPAAESVRPMPRDRFVLRFTGGPEGTTYDIRVTTTGAAPVARSLRDASAEFRVPPEALAGLPRHAKILWQVTAYLPDGRVSDSETFLAEIE